MTPAPIQRRARNASARGEWGVLAGIAVATLLIGFAGFALRPSGSSADDIRRSALRTTPDGVAALHRAIARLGPPTATRLTPLVDADPLRGSLVMLQPLRRPSPREVHELLEWVRSGGTFLHAPRGDSPILDSLGLVRRSLAADGDSAEARGEATWSRHILTDGLPPPGPARYAIAPDTASGDEEAEEESGDDDEPRPDPVAYDPLLLTSPDSAGHRWTAAAAIPLGEGRIIAFADAEPLSNRLADQEPLAVLAARAAIAYTSPGDTVFFDEFSQGLGQSRSPARATIDFLFGTRTGRASLHLGLVVLVALFCAGLRFGSPLAMARDPRRSALEHVEALAAVYESAQARETAAVLLLWRLARLSRLPPPRDASEAMDMVTALENRSRFPDPLRLIRRGLEADPVDLTSIARGIDDHTQRRISA